MKTSDSAVNYFWTSSLQLTVIPIVVSADWWDRISPGNDKLIIGTSVVGCFWSAYIELIEVKSEMKNENTKSFKLSIWADISRHRLPELADVRMRLDDGQLTGIGSVKGRRVVGVHEKRVVGYRRLATSGCN